MTAKALPRQLITLSEFSRRLQKPEAAIRAEILAGRLPWYMHRGSYLIPDEELERYRESTTTTQHLAQGQKEIALGTYEALSSNWQFEKSLSPRRRKWGRYEFDGEGKGISYSGTIWEAGTKKDIEIVFIKPKSFIGLRLRWRAMVLLDRRIMVEFVEADGPGPTPIRVKELVRDSTMLSVLRNPEGRLVKDRDSVPENYLGFEKEKRLDIYDKLIRHPSPKMSSSRVILCRLNRRPTVLFQQDKAFQRELNVMGQHALQRLRDLQIRKSDGFRMARKRRPDFPDDTYIVAPKDEEALIRNLNRVALHFAQKFKRPHDDYHGTTTDRPGYREAWFQRSDREGEFASIGFEPDGTPLYWSVQAPPDPKLLRVFLSKGYKKEGWYCWRYLIEVKPTFAGLPTEDDKVRFLIRTVKDLLAEDRHLRQGRK